MLQARQGTTRHRAMGTRQISTDQKRGRSKVPPLHATMSSHNAMCPEMENDYVMSIGEGKGKQRGQDSPPGPPPSLEDVRGRKEFQRVRVSVCARAVGKSGGVAA